MLTFRRFCFSGFRRFGVHWLLDRVFFSRVKTSSTRTVASRGFLVGRGMWTNVRVPPRRGRRSRHSTLFLGEFQDGCIDKLRFHFWKSFLTPRIWQHSCPPNRSWEGRRPRERKQAIPTGIGTIKQPPKSQPGPWVKCWSHQRFIVGNTLVLIKLCIFSWVKILKLFLWQVRLALVEFSKISP